MRIETNGLGWVGCLIWLIGLPLIGLLGDFCISSALGDLFGGDAVARWQDINIVIRLAVGFIASEIAVPVAVVVWLITLGTGAPIIT